MKKQFGEYYLAFDILFQGINYLTLAAAIKQIPPASQSE